MISDYIFSLIYIIMPWLLGYYILKIIGLNKDINEKLISIGYGYFVGYIVVYFLLKIWAYSGIELDNIKLISSVAILIASVIIYDLILHRNEIDNVWKLRNLRITPKVNRTEKVIIIILIFWGGVRLTSLFFELIVQPLYPWDAYTAWLPKARYWHFQEQFTQIISFSEWRDLGKSKLGYIHSSSLEHDFIPLVVVWASTAIGNWDEAIILLPWLLAFIAYMFGFIGQLFVADVNIKLILFSVILLLSIPIINVHIALAGYADLWLSCLYGLGVAALYNHNTRNASSQLVLLALMTLGCLIVKKESGLAWASILTVTWLIKDFKIKPLHMFLIIASCLTVFSYLIYKGVNINIIDNHYLVLNKNVIVIPWLFSSFIPDDIPTRIIEILENMYIYQTWQFFWYLSAIVCILIIKSKTNENRFYLLFSVLASFGTIIIYTMLKDFYTRPIDTFINRSLMQVLLGFIFILTTQLSKIIKFTNDLKQPIVPTN